MRTLRLSALLLTCAWIASAQERPIQDKPVDKHQDKDKPVQKDAIPAATYAKDTHFLHKGKDVIGADIRDQSREELGEVKDLVLNREGWIDYAVLELDKGLGSGAKLYAVPWAVLQPAMGKDADECEFVFAVDKERLRAAPSFSDDHWPDVASADWARPVDEFYGSEVRSREASSPIGNEGAPVARPAGLTRGMGVRATELRGCNNVKTSTGEKAGEIEEIGLDQKNGRVALLVLSTGGFLGLGEDHHAVPWQALSFSRESDGDDKDDQKLVCRLNIPESKLENAPKFERDWVKVSDPMYTERVYTHFGYPVYWKTDATKHSNEPQKDDVDDDEDDDDNG